MDLFLPSMCHHIQQDNLGESTGQHPYFLVTSVTMATLAMLKTGTVLVPSLNSHWATPVPFLWIGTG